MGSYTLLQIVGSTIIGGFLILMLFRFSGVLTEKKQRYETKNIIQNNLSEVSNLINTDLNKIGYCKDRVKAAEIFSEAITEADSSTFAFKTDVSNSELDPFGDGVVDILKYYLGAEITSTVNSNDKIFYRKVNSDKPLEINFGITKLNFKYYNSSGTLLSTPVISAELPTIAMVEYSITVEDVYGYNYSYMSEKTDVKEGDTYFMTMNSTNIITIINLKNR
ncbi:MAG: hypothetical protein GY936_03080 [Ignavibacteriae bacterium]|nr:hypothetical protein [Ignavibacteriota bacterium]